MADYTGTARTNYFRVKDPDSFLKDLQRHGIALEGEYRRGVEVRRDSEEPNAVSLVSRADEWPYLEEVEETLRQRTRLLPSEFPEAALEEGEAPLMESIQALIAAHICEDDAALLIEARTGENVECFDAAAMVVTTAGVRWSLNLTEIAMGKARLFGAKSEWLEA